jgi:hypothetical protein
LLKNFFFIDTYIIEFFGEFFNGAKLGNNISEIKDVVTVVPFKFRNKAAYTIKNGNYGSYKPQPN